jgi:hypothetical protein
MPSSVPSLLGGDREIVEVVARVHRRDQVLAAILDPAHRMSDLHGDGGDRDVLRHQPVLAAEAAADVGRDHPDLVLGQAQRLGEARSASRARPGWRGGRSSSSLRWSQ